MEPGNGHWQRWHEAYEDADSPLSLRLRLVQEELRVALGEAGERSGERSGERPVRIVSMCAGQGRDVIDVLVPGSPVVARLVELDPVLAAQARRRAADAGLAGQVEVVEGDAGRAGAYVGAVPADVVLVCGVLGNISDADIAGTVAALPSLCAPGAEVIWTRHRRPPDKTPMVRAEFAAAGFGEVAFRAPPDPYVMTVGRHRLEVPPVLLDPEARFFRFVGDGVLPA